jgi:hypothetical protein
VSRWDCSQPADTPRPRSRRSSYHRHCEERSEAIHLSPRGQMNCFASLAMTATKRPHSRGSFRPRLCISLSLSASRGRRESRALDAPAVPCAKSAQKSTRVKLQVQPRHPGFPRAMVLRLIRTLPGEAAFLAPVAGGNSRPRSARVAAPGPHDFAVRCRRFVR